MNYLQVKKIRFYQLKYIFILLVIALAVFVLFKKDSNKTSNDQKEVKEYITSVEVEEFKIKKFSKKLIFRGFTESSREVILKSQVDGRISNVSFKRGSDVPAGQQIVLIDPEDKVAKVKEMEALFDQRKKEYEVAEKLFKKGFRSEVNLSKARSRFENSLALFEKSQVELNNTKIIIPFDCFIEESYVELGDYVQKGDKIVKVVDLDPMYLTVTVSEKNIANLEINQKAKAFLANGVESTGYINYISTTADEQTRNFKVQIEIDNPKNKILSGLSGELHIKLNPIDAYFIPSSIVTLNDEGVLGIKGIAEERVIFMPINILSDTGKGYWIKSVTNNKLTIITRGQEYVKVGEVVESIYKK